MTQNRTYPNQGNDRHNPRTGGSPRSYGGEQLETSRISDQELARIDFGANMSAEIFGDIAQKTAQKVYRSDKKSNKRTQLRKFYDEIVLWNERVQQESAKQRVTKFHEVEPFVKMLKAKVVYAKGRKYVDETFTCLFSHCLNQVTDPPSLNRCKLFIEAFLGFYRVYED